MYKQGIPAEVLARRVTPQPQEAVRREWPGNGGVPDQGEPANQTETGALQGELATLRDKYLRLAADFDNFKKRTQRENEHRAAAQKEAIVRDLLPVLDNLERSVASAKGHVPEQLRRGVQMIWQQALQVLKQHGFESQEDLGQPFDPDRHEAVVTRADAAHPDHVVLEVWQRGWRRATHLFRPAKVVVNDLQTHPHFATSSNSQP